MKKLLRNRGARAKSPSSHRCEVRGYAPFARFSGGCVVRFDLSDTIEVSASGGLLGTPSTPSTIEGGTFRITALDTCHLTAEYGCPVYLLNYTRLRDVLRNRFDLETWLRPHWRENVWPYLFDFYMSYGKWPVWKLEYARIFRHILSKARINEIAAAHGGGQLQRVRARIVAALLARLSIRWSAEKLAAHAKEVAQALFNSEQYEELVAEMEMLGAISAEDSVILLAGEYVADEIWFKVPFERAHAKKLSVTGAVKVEHKCEYGDFFDRELVCSYLELYPISPIAIPRVATLLAPQARIPLDVGEKKVYGMTVNAPVTCKVENVLMTLLKPRKRFLSFARRKKSFSDADPSYLHFELFGTEA